jgi:glucosamine--fructose-6-phosphate aminotransferase (isomerizing)
MCGIVGYLGHKEASRVIISGLRRLEYRGYDSAGIALTGDPFYINKRRGKILELTSGLDFDALKDYHAGIGHTRWATHGEPNEINAHPHTDCGNVIAIVHNGIIENYLDLKKALHNDGHVFRSETDTEVIAHLIEHFHSAEPLVDAVIKALQMVEGAYGILVISNKEPDRIIAARKGSPLILGIGDGEMVVASDACAIVDHTRNAVYLEDNEVIEITRDSYWPYDMTKKSLLKNIEAIDWDIASIEKRGFDYFMLKEIYEQPETVHNAFRGRLLLDSGNVRLDGLMLCEEELADINRIIFIACGTSWHAGLIGEYLIEEYAQIPVEVEYASEFRYRKPVLRRNDLVITISQSGETIDTLAALREAQNRGVKVLGITNIVGSTIARESDGGVYIHAGPEIGVASTKAFTSQITVLALLTIFLARRGGMTAVEGTRLIEELQRIPDIISSILSESSLKVIKEIAELYSHHRNFLYLGRGIHFPVALEGALKLKEISYIHAEGYPAAEMKHGPIALIDEEMPVVFIAPRDEVYDKIVNNIEQVKARKGRIIAVATEGDKDITRYADHVIYVPVVNRIFSPIVTVIPLQLLAYYIAVKRGCDVDQPRNLAKSVTVE